MQAEPGLSSLAQMDHPHVFQPWMRLYKNEQRVGYARCIRDAQWLYSIDGYGWSDRVIEFDRSVSQIPLRLHAQRVFHGDLVQMTAYAGAQNACEKIVLMGPERHIFLCDVDTLTVHNLQELWPPPSRPRVTHILGSVLHDVGRMKTIQRRLDAVCGADPFYRLKLSMLTLAIALGMTIAGMIQKTFLQHVGPLTAMGGGLVGALVFWWLLRRWDWHALRRRTILRMSFHAALLLGGMGCLLFPILNGGLFTELTSIEPFVRTAAVGMLGFLTGLICGIIGAELVTWRTEGYADDSSVTVGFRRD